MREQGDGVCELGSLELDTAGDDCWHRSPKRVRTSTRTGVNTAAPGSSGATDEQALSLREMVETWTKAGAVEGPAIALSQVQQLLVAVEVRIYLPLFVRV